MPRTVREAAPHTTHAEPSAAAASVAHQWLNGLHIKHSCHHRLTSRYEIRARAMSIIVVVATTIVGTAIFSSLSESQANWAKIATGVMSIAAAVLTATSTALRYPEAAERHRAAAVAYGALRRRFEQELSSDPRDVQPLLARVRTEWDQIDAAAPAVPDRLIDRVTKDVVASADALQHS